MVVGRCKHHVTYTTILPGSPCNLFLKCISNLLSVAKILNLYLSPHWSYIKPNNSSHYFCHSFPNLPNKMKEMVRGFFNCKKWSVDDHKNKQTQMVTVLSNLEFCYSNDKCRVLINKMKIRFWFCGRTMHTQQDSVSCSPCSSVPQTTGGGYMKWFYKCIMGTTFVLWGF